jgi:beta-xylosidase
MKSVVPPTHVPNVILTIMTVILATAASGADSSPSTRAPWISDQGDGTYRNPVIFADYSDPDVIRVGDDFYLVSSSFLSAPGLPLLHSKDLVNWTIINHVFAEQQPADYFSKPRHGQGVWAPAIRYHGGRFWITYPDPDFGLYLTTATDPAGAWTPPQLILPGKGLIDPCPFWDDDGRLYLIHGWAKSRAGIANLLTLRQLSSDGTRMLDEGKVIIDGNQIPGWNTLEGPKLYKRNGYYYVFAPSGGVAIGYQAVFRARNIYGPYEHRIVLAQGRTSVNGPHQGAWVDTPSGEDWFLHFQDCGPFGRVVHLEPMVWRDDWPAIGTSTGGTGPGEPVLLQRKPNIGRSWPITVPQTSDEFDSRALALQWQWNANPRAAWFSLSARPGFLRLYSVPAPATRNDGSPAEANVYDAPNILLQKFPAPAFTVTTAMDFLPAKAGETAGLVVYGYHYAVLGLRCTPLGKRLVLLVNNNANEPGTQEHEEAGIDVGKSTVILRVSVDSKAVCRFFYSLDQTAFQPIGGSFQAFADRWVGARVGLFATSGAAANMTGHADFDWFRVTQNPSQTPTAP